MPDHDAEGKACVRRPIAGSSDIKALRAYIDNLKA